MNYSNLLNNTLHLKDTSRGYEKIAREYIKFRGCDPEATGAEEVRKWAGSLKKAADVLDLGCGTGIPITKILVDAGMKVSAIDASKTMVTAFKRNFPKVPVICESIEESCLFHKKFDAMIAWGLIFLFSEKEQIEMLNKLSQALRKNGKLLFTAPTQEAQWKDAMTHLNSVSLGAENYYKVFSECGLRVIEEFKDRGENHYYHCEKISD